MSERLVIIDGKSVLYRGYYAMPNLSTRDGKPTGGVYGFAVMALEVIKRFKPDYVCVAWDKRHTNIRRRRELYPEYKANRKAAPEDFYDQVAILQDVLKSLGWPLYELDDYEADDIMATLALKAKAKDIETYLISGDFDLLQTVNSHTHVCIPRKGFSEIELFNEAAFREKYGVGPHQWADVKALQGDSSDNIPGVHLVGPKSALELISTYETLEGVYEHLPDIKPNLRAKLEKDRDMAFLGQKLVTLYTDAPLELEFDKMRLPAEGVPPAFIAKVRELEFRTLLRQLEAAQAQAGVEAETDENAAGYIKQLEEAKQVPFSEKAFAGDEPRLIALSPDAVTLWLSAKPGEYSAVQLSDLHAGVLQGPVIGHDLKAIFRALLAANIEPPQQVAHDTRLSAFILNSLQRSLELSDLIGQTIAADDPGRIITATWQLYNEQQKEFKKAPTLEKVARRLDFPMVPLLATVEHRGILLDTAYLRQMSDEFEIKIVGIEQKIYKEAGDKFNISSPAQLGTVLYEKLGLPTTGVKKGKTGYSTGSAELDKLRGLHPIINLITEYREYTKLKSTYIDALPKLVDAGGKLHTTYAQDVAATGRLSSHDPNLQNIPTRTELGQAIRGAFKPAEGNVFVSADYSQFELRLAAYMADDKQMLEDFNKDIDIHTATAAQVAGVPLEQVDKEMRRRAKAVNFGILYGMSPHGLSVATGMTIMEAKEFIERYFALRAPLRKYMEHTAELALKQGYVETIFGRRRPTPDMKSSNWVVREAAKRAAINMPIQGTEADLMKMAMLKVEKALDGLGEQLLQIHDSILVECPAENAEKVAEVLKDTMEHVYDLPVKLAVDVKTGKDWGEI
ncbi:MAG TPA: DNA polymerase I [Candidatus Saccharimonadales bacterium]|nr:DNA polymerase I [Candidatus Saccharimonadales bacterium]